MTDGILSAGVNPIEIEIRSLNCKRLDFTPILAVPLAAAIRIVISFFDVISACLGNASLLVAGPFLDARERPRHVVRSGMFWIGPRPAFVGALQAVGPDVACCSGQVREKLGVTLAGHKQSLSVACVTCIVLPGKDYMF